MTGSGCMAKTSFRLTALVFISECWGYTCAPPGCSCLTCPFSHPPPSLPSLLAFHSCSCLFLRHIICRCFNAHAAELLRSSSVPWSHLAASILDSNFAPKLSAVGQFKSRSRQSIPFSFGWHTKCVLLCAGYLPFPLRLLGEWIRRVLYKCLHWRFCLWHLHGAC